MRIWARDGLPEEWQPNMLHKPIVVGLGSGRFIVVDFLNVMESDKDCNKMFPGKEFAIFTGVEVAFSNAGKGKGMMRGLHMSKHKSHRYMFNNQQRIEAVL
ncbi:hypothetical protein VPH35_017722 [Triticum aestivum]